MQQSYFIPRWLWPIIPSILCLNYAQMFHFDYMHVLVLRPLLHFASLFVFDLDGFGYNCVADRDVELYGITASFFWGVPLCFVILGLVTNLTPLLKRRGLAWQTTKTVNCIGHFLQVASTTMASVGLLPFMCYDHPNGNWVVNFMLKFSVADRKGLILSRSFLGPGIHQRGKQSILKYSNTLCGSAEHLSMQIIGTSLLVLSVSFFSMCCFAAWKAPTWSAGPKASSRIPAIVFLIQRFRPSKWWFGLIIVGRGCCLLEIVKRCEKTLEHIGTLLGNLNRDLRLVYTFMLLSQTCSQEPRRNCKQLRISYCTNQVQHPEKSKATRAKLPPIWGED